MEPAKEYKEYYSNETHQMKNISSIICSKYHVLMKKAITTLILITVVLGIHMSGISKVYAQDQTNPDKKDEEPDQPAKTEEEKEKEKKGKTLQLPDMVVIASKTEKEVFETPAAVSLSDKKELDRKQVISAVDALDDKIGIWVEKRTSEASDPIMRGFSGYYIHAFVDGNSLSTLWGEGGPAGSAMYASIDPDSLERVEVVRGPSSVLYGTNAIGGVINFITRDPIDYTDEGFTYEGLIKLLYGSSAQQKRGYMEITGASPDFRFLLGGSLADIGDVSGGRGEGVYDPSSAKYHNWLGKFGYRLGEDQELFVSLWDVRVNNHKRYYYPTESRDIDREAIELFYRASDLTSFWDRFETKLYFQNKHQVSHNESDHAGRISTSDYVTYALDLQAESMIGDSHGLTYGLHFNRDRADRQESDPGYLAQYGYSVKKNEPDPIWDNIGTYLQDEWQVTDWFTLIPGLRYDYYRYRTSPDARFPIPSGYSSNDFDIDDKKTSITGGLEGIFRLTDHLNLTTHVSRGFRQPAPNLSVSQNSTGISVPSTDLKPETATTFEAGLRTQCDEFRGGLTLYRTILRNFLRSDYTTWQGQAWSDQNGDGIPQENEYYKTKENSGKGYVTGVEIEGGLQLGETFEADWLDNWELFGGFNWMTGYDRSADETLYRINPPRGILGVRWENPSREGLWLEFQADMVRKSGRLKENQVKSDPAYWRDPQDGSSGPYRSDWSLPGYTVFDLRCGYP
ncbi:MAG: TonB-dependent receptor, partial [Planctomycetota bacterium]